jgi:hypothetical protein
MKKRIVRDNYLSIDSSHLAGIRGLVGEYFVSDWISLVSGFSSFYKSRDLRSKGYLFDDSNSGGISVSPMSNRYKTSTEVDGLVKISDKNYLVEVKTCDAEFINPFILNKLNPNLEFFNGALGDDSLSYLLFLSKNICDVSLLSGNLSNSLVIDMGFSKDEILNFSLEVADFLKSKR